MIFLKIFYVTDELQGYLKYIKLIILHYSISLRIPHFKTKRQVIQDHFHISKGFNRKKVLGNSRLVQSY